MSRRQLQGSVHGQLRHMSTRARRSLLQTQLIRTARRLRAPPGRRHMCYVWLLIRFVPVNILVNLGLGKRQFLFSRRLIAAGSYHARGVAVAVFVAVIVGVAVAVTTSALTRTAGTVGTGSPPLPSQQPPTQGSENHNHGPPDHPTDNGADIGRSRRRVVICARCLGRAPAFALPGCS